MRSVLFCDERMTHMRLSELSKIVGGEGRGTQSRASHERVDLP